MDMRITLRYLLLIGLILPLCAMAQQRSEILSVSASIKTEEASLAFDKDVKTKCTFSPQELKSEQWVMCTIGEPGDVSAITMEAQGVSKEELKSMFLSAGWGCFL